MSARKYRGRVSKVGGQIAPLGGPTVPALAIDIRDVDPLLDALWHYAALDAPLSDEARAALAAFGDKQ